MSDCSGVPDQLTSKEVVSNSTNHRDANLLAKLVDTAKRGARYI